MEYRSFPLDLELRSAGSKRLLCGIVVPYRVETRIRDSLVERFEAGAFAHQFGSAHRVRLLAYHSDNPSHLQLGHAVELRDDAAGLYGELRVVDSERGDHYLALVREHSLDQWSVGFRPVRDRMDGRVTVRCKADLFEIALVPEGAYGELASVAAMRSAPAGATRDALLARLPKSRLPA